MQALYDAIEAAKAVTDKPSFIVLRTIIGWPAPTKQNTGAAHGSALGDAEVAATKEILGFDPAVKFPVEEEAARAGARGRRPRQGRSTRSGTRSSRAGKIRIPNGPRSSPGWPRAPFPRGGTAALPSSRPTPRAPPPGEASGKVLTALAPVLPELWGGSADLAESNITTMEGEPSFLPANRQTEMWPGGPYGRTLHFGIREHGMGSILNGIAVHGGTRVYGGTFLQFSDYMRGRRAAGGADGAAGHLRLDARLDRPRRGRPDAPADRAPVVAAEHPAPRRGPPGRRQRDRRRRGRPSSRTPTGPAGLCLSRQNVPTFDRAIFASADGGGPRGVRDGRRRPTSS